MINVKESAPTIVVMAFIVAGIYILANGVGGPYYPIFGFMCLMFAFFTGMFSLFA